MTKRSYTARALALFLALLIAEPAWLLAVTQGPELPNPGDVGVSKQDQEQLGLKAAGEVYQQMPVLPDSSPVTQYVQQLGKKLQQVIPQQYSWPYQFHVVEQKEINAFALPGGPIFVNIGTITSADSEAQLAGVMAHEMSHVYMQHSVKQMKQNTGPSILAGLGQVLGQMIGGVGGAIASLGGQITGGLLSMKYSRKDEAQADWVGAIIMYKAGYDARQMAEFFQKLEKEGGAGGPQFLSDHPNPGNRVQAVDNEIKDWPPKNFQQNETAFTQAKQRATQIKAYTGEEIAAGAKQGTWARQNQQNHSIPSNVPLPSSSPAGSASPSGNVTNVSYQQVRPSGNFKQLQQGGLTISYPDNWQLFSGSSGGITIAPAAGVSQQAIAYGVVIDVAQDPNATSLDQATQNLIRGLQQNNNLRVAGTPQRITVNGQQGRSVDLIGTSPVQQNGQPVQEHDWLVTLPNPQGGGLVYLVFVAPENSFSQLRSTYRKMLRSLRLGG